MSDFASGLYCTSFHPKVLSTLLNEMDGIGVRLGEGTSKGTKSAEAEDNIGSESEVSPDSEVKVGSQQTLLFFDKLRVNVLMSGVVIAQDSFSFLERNLQYNVWFLKPKISCLQR